MKKTLSVILCTAIMLTSCMINNGDNHTKQVDYASLVPIEQVYDGYEKLCGKEYKNFKMPSEIAAEELSEIYELDCNIEKAQEPYDNIREIYKAFYGENYNENYVVSDEHGGLIYSGENAEAYYWGTEISLISGEISADDLKTYYNADISSEQTVTLGGNKVKISELCKNTGNSLADILQDFYGDYQLEVKSISVYETGEVADFTCGICYKGVPFQYKLSNYFSTDGSGENSYWTASCLYGSVDSQNNITYINASAPYNIVGKKQVTEIISLSEAVNILDNNLSPKSFYEFSSVELMYCCLTKQPEIDYTNIEKADDAEKLAEEYNLEIKTFLPYWCFEINKETDLSGTEYIKVNALTGEIFMDFE